MARKAPMRHPVRSHIKSDGTVVKRHSKGRGKFRSKSKRLVKSPTAESTARLSRGILHFETEAETLYPQVWDIRVTSPEGYSIVVEEAIRDEVIGTHYITNKFKIYASNKIECVLVEDHPITGRFTEKIVYASVSDILEEKYDPEKRLD